MAAPYSTGGGGFRFEDRVTAYYAATMLAEVSSRGLIGEHPISIATQRAQLGDPLDDIIITGRTVGGENTKLSLQLKSNITLTKANAEWRACIVSAWETVFSDSFKANFDHVGVALATLPARYDAHYRPVLNWARYSHDGADFIARINLKDFSNQTRAQFVSDIREIAKTHVGRAPTDDEIWRLLRSFVILHFDFNAEASSADESAAIAVLQTFLSSDDRSRSRDIWNALNVYTSQIIPAAGSLSRDQILERLSQQGLPVGLQPSFGNEIGRIHAESKRAISEIQFKIGSLHIHRLEAYEELTNADSSSRFIQLISEPGAGKSALLREVAEQWEIDGPLFFLKNDRIHPRGWPSMATALGIKCDLDSLISAFASSGGARLFIDGIDRITDPAAQVTINDILRAIIASETAASWTVLVTVREQNLRHISTWLDEDVLKQLGVRSVTVKPLTRTEKSVVAQNIPRLKELLNGDNVLGVLLSRPFFLNAILKLSSQDTLSPASEAELLDLWWELGGSSDTQFPSAQRRRDTLIELATLAVSAPNQPLPIAGFDPNALEELRSADVIRDSSLGHSVAFTHDIYEEWATTELLIRNEGALPKFLSSAGEPQTLTRALQLVVTRMVEREDCGDKWLTLLGNLDTNEMRPVWLRMATSAPLHSTRTGALLDKLRPNLYANDGAILQTLIRSLHTVEVVPNLRMLEQDELAIDYEMRVKLAELFAIPKGPVWLRFFEWLLPTLDELPAQVVPELVTAMLTWQKTFGGIGVKFCREIGAKAYEWLRRAEEAFHPKNFSNREHPFGKLGYDVERAFEKSLRELFLESAGDVPELIVEYLAHHTRDRRLLHLIRKDVIANSTKLVQHTPTALVDFILSAYIATQTQKKSRSYQDDLLPLGRGFGFEDEFAFYPASPLQPPFLPLLRFNTEEGLRLIHGITNHATRRLEASYKKQGYTLIPLELDFPWGSQSFVGDRTAYCWYRGMGSANIVESALMALEQWALEELDKGTSLLDLLERILHDADSVALIGIAVSLSLAAEMRAVPTALPFVMSQRLWNWDLERHLHDYGTHPNLIGNWNSDRIQMEAVRKLNDRPHRKKDIRNLVGLFLLGTEDDRARYREAWTDFEISLPFELEEHLADAQHVLSLKEKAQMFAQQADLDNYGLVRGDDDQIYIVQTNAPYAEDPKHKAQIEKSIRLDAAMKLAMWAERSRKSGLADPGMTIDAALNTAIEMTDDELFAFRDQEDFGEEYYLAAGIAGTAYVIAHHLPADQLHGETLSWCLHVLEMAATVPERANLGGRSSMSTMSPPIFAAYGYSALLSRDIEVDRAKLALLNLAIDPMESVSEAVCKSALIYEILSPRFVYILLNVMLRRCIFGMDDRPEHNSIFWSASEAEAALSLLAQAEHALASEEMWPLPTIPMSWLNKGVSNSKNIEDFEQNETLFDYRLAEKTALALPIQGLLSDPMTRSSLVGLAGELLQYTSEEIYPPFNSKKGDFGSPPYEWIHAFSQWLGLLDVALLSHEGEKGFVNSVLCLPDKVALSVLEGVMRVYLIDAILAPKEISSRAKAAWDQITSWLLSHDEADAAFENRHIDRDFQSCAIMVLFCATVDLNRLVCGADREWRNIGQFQKTVAEAVVKFGNHHTLFYAASKLLCSGGMAFLPDPGLSWLKQIAVANRAKSKFWESAGDSMVDVLKELLKVYPALSVDHIATILFVADVLVDNGVRGAGFLQQEISKRV